MSVADFESGLPVEEYVRSLPVERRVKLPTKAEEQEDFGIRDDEGCGTTCQRITEALLRANSGGKRKTKKRRRKRRKKSRKKRKRKTRRKLRKRKKKTKRRRRR